MNKQTWLSLPKPPSKRLAMGLSAILVCCLAGAGAACTQLAWRGAQASTTKAPSAEELAGDTHLAAASHQPLAAEDSPAGRRAPAEAQPHWAEAQSAPAAGEVLAYGRTDYDQTRLVQLSSRVAGTVWRVQRRLGEFVRAGETIAIIESSEVGAAKSALLASLATLECQTRLVQRLRQLDPAVVSLKQVDLAEAELRRARVELFNAQQNLLNLGLHVDLETLIGADEQQALASLRLLGLGPEVVASLDPQSTTANLLPLAAPSDGVVIGSEIVCGEVVGPGVPLATLADVRQMWIRLDVAADRAAQLRLGQRVTFVPDDQGSPVESQLSWISTEVDPRTRTVEVRATFVPRAVGDSTSGAPFRAYTYGQGTIHPDPAHLPVVVPSQAVHWNGRRHVVLVARPDGVRELRGVCLGGLDEGLSVIQAGLAPGERVLVAGGHNDDDLLWLGTQLAESKQPAS